MTDQMPDHHTQAQHDRDNLLAQLDACRTARRWQDERLAAAERERDERDGELLAARRELEQARNTIAAMTATAPDPTTVDDATAKLEHLTGQYRRACAELDRSLRETVTVTRQRDQLVDDLDVCRGARDRYQRATARLRAELNTAVTLQHSAQAIRDEIAHRIDVLDAQTRNILDEEVLTVGELRHWLRTGSPSPATVRRGDPQHVRADEPRLAAIVDQLPAGNLAQAAATEAQTQAVMTVMGWDDDRRHPGGDGVPPAACWTLAGEVAQAVIAAAQTAPDAPTPATPDLSTVIADRIASANLDGPADTMLARATIAVDTVLDALPADGYISDVDREDVAKAVLDTLEHQLADRRKQIVTQLAEAARDRTAAERADLDAMLDSIIDAERKRAAEQVAEARAVESQKADDRVGAVQAELQQARDDAARWQDAWRALLADAQRADADAGKARHDEALAIRDLKACREQVQELTKPVDPQGGTR